MPQTGCFDDLKVNADYMVVCDNRDNTLRVDTNCYIVLAWSTGETTQTITVNRPGSYWVYARSDQDRAEYFDTIVVQSGNAPKPVIGNPQEYLCRGDEASLKAPNTMKSYLWSTGETGNEITVTEAGVYWLEVTDSNDCVGRSDEIEIIIVELPDPVLSGPNSVCRNSSGTYSVESLPNATYIWLADGGTILSGSGTPNVEIEWNRNGRLEVEVLQTRPDGGTCSGKAGMFITVGDKLKPEILYNRSSLCVGESIVLEAPSGYAEYLWNTGSTSRIITVTQGGPYWVEVKNAADCNGRSDTLNVRVYELPSATVIGPRAVCGVGQTVTLQGIDAIGDVVLWEWSTGDRTQNITVNRAGTYTLVAWNLNGCTDTARFTVGQAAPIDVRISPVNFGSVEVGSQPTASLDVVNNSNVNISVIEILGLPAGISLSPMPPRLVMARTTESFTMQWQANSIGTIQHTATLVLASADCTDTIQAQITGQAVNTDTVGIVTISSADTTLEVGSYLALPIYVDVSLPLGEAADIRFETTFRNDIYHVDKVQGAQVLLDQSVGTLRTITMSIDVISDTSQIVLFSGYTLLASPFMTLVDIDNISVTSNAPFITDEQDGSVTLTGCWLPGRMVHFGELQLVKRVFTIDGREVFPGGHCRPCLEVYFDLNGRPVGNYLTNNISR